MRYKAKLTLLELRGPFAVFTHDGVNASLPLAYFGEQLAGKEWRVGETRWLSFSRPNDFMAEILATKCPVLLVRPRKRSTPVSSRGGRKKAANAARPNRVTGDDGRKPVGALSDRRLLRRRAGIIEPVIHQSSDPGVRAR